MVQARLLRLIFAETNPFPFVAITEDRCELETEPQAEARGPNQHQTHGEPTT